MYERLRDAFRLEPLGYFPDTAAAMRSGTDGLPFFTSAIASLAAAV